MSSTRVVDFGNVRRSHPGITICSPAAVRSTSDMLGSELIDWARVAHPLACTYTGRLNPQKKSIGAGLGVFLKGADMKYVMVARVNYASKKIPSRLKDVMRLANRIFAPTTIDAERGVGCRYAAEQAAGVVSR